MPIPDPDALRVCAVLILAIAQAAMAFWPDLRGWPDTIASRSAALATPVVPIPPAFAIWGPLFAGCLLFAVWHASPALWDDPLMREVGWAAAALFALNTAWAAWVPRRGLGWPSVALIAGELALAVWLLWATLGGPWWAAWPLGGLAGWITAAAFVNLSSTLLRWHMAGGPAWADARRPAVAGALIGCMAALGLWLVAATGSLSFALAFGWALVGVALANRRRLALALGRAA